MTEQITVRDERGHTAVWDVISGGVADLRSDLDSEIARRQEVEATLFATAGTGAWGTTLASDASVGDLRIIVKSCAGARAGMPLTLGTASDTLEDAKIASVVYPRALVLESPLEASWPAGTPVFAVPAGYEKLRSEVEDTSVERIPSSGEDERPHIVATFSAFPHDALKSGGVIEFGSGPHYISAPVEITVPGSRMTSKFGGMLNISHVRLVALPGFSGPMVKFNIPSGEKGALVDQLMLDGNNEPGVTAGIEYANGTIARADVRDVNIVRIPYGWGIMTGSNQQSYGWENVEAWYLVGGGMSIGAGARHITVRDCIFGGNDAIGGSGYAALIGADSNVSRCESIGIERCELYGFGNTEEFVLFRGVDSASIVSNYIERDSGGSSVLNAMLGIGTASATANYVSVERNRFGGNSKASYGVRLVNAPFAYIGPNARISTLETVLVDNDDTDSVATLFGTQANSYVGILSAEGANGISGGSFRTPVSHGDIAGIDSFRSYVTGEAYPRYVIRNNAGFESGPGSDAIDTTFGRNGSSGWLSNRMITAIGGFANGSSGPRWTSGSGSPEGAVAAPIGSLYSRTDGGVGTSLYVKQSGTGSTGWTPIA